jgi:hypothetical protein
MLSKFDLAVIIAGLAAFVGWTEHAHRIVIESPVPARIAPAAVSPCPENDNVADSVSCLVFIKGDAERETSSWVAAPDRVVSLPHKAPAQFASHSTMEPCSDSDNVPYTASCLQFLSGWLWRPDTTKGAAIKTYAP